MSLQEWLALVAFVAAPLLWIAKLQICLMDGLADIKKALLGDQYGHPGLVKEFSAMQESQVRMELRVDEIERRLEAIEAQG